MRAFDECQQVDEQSGRRNDKQGFKRLWQPRVEIEEEGLVIVCGKEVVIGLHQKVLQANFSTIEPLEEVLIYLGKVKRAHAGCRGGAAEQTDLIIGQFLFGEDEHTCALVRIAGIVHEQRHMF
ncbi:hypothetical protein SDC9_157549 [bioreactor metagenome]|uniref:Uncharacterized protein n=1 Tax=bioreactor metagenome TaxID=1076179 RepID=A0A645FCG0_9ZZZZ